MSSAFRMVYAASAPRQLAHGWGIYRLFFAVLVGCLAASDGAAADLSYQWREGREVGYAFKLDAIIDDETYTTSGVSILLPSKSTASDEDGESGGGTGTGFVIRKDGYLITCAHVVEGATKIDIRLGEKNYVGEVVAMDKPNDLAIVKIDAEDLPVLPLADSEKVQLGEEVRVVGFPLSNVLGSSIKITRGSVAGIVENGSEKVLQVDAAINPGNSGGPVVNDKGEVIGVASAKLTGEAVSDVGFAVPANFARKLLETKDITYETKGADEALDGPTLAKRVSPAVAFFTVTVGPGGVGAAERYNLTFRGYTEESSTEKPKKKPEREKFDGGQILANTLGSVSQEELIVPELPFGMGSQGMVGFERLSDDGDDAWTFREVTSISKVMPTGPVSHRRGEQQKTTTVNLPIIRQAEYEVGETQGDGTLAIQKSYHVVGLTGKGKPPFMEVEMEGTVYFDPVAGRTTRAKMTGTLRLATGEGVVEIPIIYEYHQIDPRSIKGGKKRRGGAYVARVGEGGPSALRRPKVPGKEARKKAQATVEKLFAKQLAETRASARTELAETMMQYARGEKDEASRFALLDAARRQAIAARDVALTTEVSDQIFRQFKINALRLEQTNVTELSKTVTAKEQRDHLAKLARALMEDAIAADDFPTALRFGGIARKMADLARNRALVQKITDRGRQVVALKKEFDKVKSAKDALAKDEKDPAANYQMGRYYCFTRGRWEQGLPLLALAEDEEVREAAGLELEEPTEAAKQVEIGDAWWAIAEREENAALRTTIQRHAAQWYRAAVPNLSGLSRRHVEQQLEQAPPELVAAVEEEVDEGDEEESGSGKRVSASSAKRMLLEKIAAAVGDEKVTVSEEVGFNLGGSRVSVVPPKGGLLVGFDIFYNAFGSIQAYRPLFHTQKGSEAGRVVGIGHNNNRQTVIAKKGYAVGSITISKSTGIDGMGVTFMRITPNGLDADDAVKSKWFGNRKNDLTVGGDGTPIVGVHGRIANGAARSIGVVFGEIGE